MRNRTINMSVLPGEPLDGSGRVCIHLFVQDERGPFVEPHVLHMEETEIGDDHRKKQLVAKATRGRLACDPKRTVALVKRQGDITVTMRTDDPRAVTCPKCKASGDYTRIMDLLSGVAK